jgi:hypothetical protein
MAKYRYSTEGTYLIDNSKYNNTNKRIVIIILCCVRNGNIEVPVYYLKAKQGFTFRKQKTNVNGYSTYIDKCRREIQEQKEVPIWYTAKYRFASSTNSKRNKPNKKFLTP